MRNDNFVYEEELFYICSSETISGKQPYLVTSAKETKVNNLLHLYLIQTNKIFGNSYWINFYQLINIYAIII